jgi:Fe-S cluster assembly protein SufD
MNTLTVDAARSAGGPDWLVQRRVAAAARAAEVGLPSVDEEIWRYSPVGELDLDAWSLPVAPGGGLPEAVTGLLAELGRCAATVVVHNGTVVLAEVDPVWSDAGVVVGQLVASDSAADALGAVAGEPSDVFGHLNDAFATDPVVVQVPAGVAVTDPVAIIDWVDADATMVAGRVVVTTGDDAAVEVLEWHGGSDVAALCLPVTELSAGPASRLRHLVVQDRSDATWQIAAVYATAGRDATVVSAQAALGGHYARTRAECRLEGRGAHGELTAAYLGEGDQTLDFRTVQRHNAPDTTSELLFCGAVADTSRAIYTGTINISPDGRGSNANQTNRNLKLSDGAWAESVPNLEIENNDVRCSHASTVGPVDADQLFYLQSRGVPPGEAERLIVTGFFAEPVGQMPVTGAAALVRHRLARRLRERGEA